MLIHRFTLRPTSLQLTPWQADTLFGSLCWAYRFRNGEEKLQEFLKPFKAGEPPFLLSDGIPSGYFPLPFHLRLQKQSGKSVEAYSKLKALKKVRFLPQDQFAEACRGEEVLVDEQAGDLLKKATQLHATINRLTGTTTAGDEGGTANLFQLDGWVPRDKSQSYSLYLADRTGNSLDTVLALLRDLELTGFGKKKSSGMGAFKIEGEPEIWNYPTTNGKANGFVSLSGFVPKQKDPTAGFWQIRVKHGKLGEEYAKGGNPFKKPWIMLEPGSVFYTGSPPGEVYGRMLERIAVNEEYKNVVQYVYAFPVPITLPKEVVSRLES